MDERPTTRQSLLAKEGLASLLALAALTAASALHPLAPVGGLAGDAAGAPWIFVGLQELLRVLPPLAAGVLLPALGLGVLAALPWLGGRPGRARAASLAGWLVLAAWAALTVLGLWRH